MGDEIMVYDNYLQSMNRNATMSIDVALTGRLASGATEILEETTKESVTFHPINNQADDDRVASIFKKITVLVGDWPESVEQAPNLEMIHQIGAGVENYDLEALPDDVYLCNVYFHAPAIAEHVFLFLLALNRSLMKEDRLLRAGRWPLRDPAGHVTELSGSTLGIVGFGHIGQALVDLAQAFGMDVVAIRGSQPVGDTPDGVSFLGEAGDLDHILTTSDAVVLSLPLTNQTRGLIGESELKMMKDTAYLLNVARGPITDEKALYEALVEGEIAGAGIDTWYQYPENKETCYPSKYPFHTLDNVVMTPHTSGWSDRTAEKRWNFIAENIDRIARGETPENIVIQT